MAIANVIARIVLVLFASACGNDDDPTDAGGAPAIADGGGTGGPMTDYCDYPLPDTGGDECMACAQEVCCDMGYAGRCLADMLVPSCYEHSLECGQLCLEGDDDRDAGSSEPADAGVPDAGTLAACLATCAPAASHLHLVQCIMASRCNAICFGTE